MKQEDWLKKVAPVVEQRIALYSQEEIHFNLMVRR